jgi:hypothetical protein
MCGDGVADPGEQCCDQATRDAFRDGLPAYYLAQAPKHLCIPRTSQTVSGVLFAVCDSTCGDGSAGCDLQMGYQNAALGGPFVSLLDSAVDVRLTATIAGIAVGCTLHITAAKASYSNVVFFSDDGLAMSTQVGTGTLTPTYMVTGCGGLQSYAVAIFQIFQSVITDAWRSVSDTTLAGYRGACPF